MRLQMGYWVLSAVCYRKRPVCIRKGEDVLKYRACVILCRAVCARYFGGTCWLHIQCVQVPFFRRGLHSHRLQVRLGGYHCFGGTNWIRLQGETSTPTYCRNFVSPFLGYGNRYQCLRSTRYVSVRGRRTSSSVMLKALRSSEMGCSLSDYTASHLSTDCHENLKSRMPFSWLLHSTSKALEHVSRGLNPTRGMYMYVYACTCVGRGPATGRIPCPEKAWSKCIKDIQNLHSPFSPSPPKNWTLWATK
jgi:hypothetical protein